MPAHPIRSMTITLLLFVAAGLVIAASVWSGGGQENRPANLAEIARPRVRMAR
jgi:hypothetical protein